MINSSHAQHTALQIPACLCEVLKGQEASWKHDKKVHGFSVRSHD